MSAGVHQVLSQSYHHDNFTITHAKSVFMHAVGGKMEEGTVVHHREWHNNFTYLWVLASTKFFPTPITMTFHYYSLQECSHACSRWQKWKNEQLFTIESGILISLICECWRPPSFVPLLSPSKFYYYSFLTIRNWIDLKKLIWPLKMETSTV